MVQVFCLFSVLVVLFFGYGRFVVWWFSRFVVSLFCCFVIWLIVVLSCSLDDVFPNKKGRLAVANLPIHEYHICTVGIYFKFFASCLV